MDETKYGFGITIKLSDEAFINHKESFIEIDVSDNVRLIIISQKHPSGVIKVSDIKSTSNNPPLGNSSLFTILSEGYRTEDHAKEIGYKIIQALKLVAIKKRFGVFTEEKQIIPRGNSRNILKLFNDLSKDFEDVHFVDSSNYGLYIYPLNKMLTTITVSSATVPSGNTRIISIGYNAKHLEEEFQATYPLASTTLNPKENLAIDLYLASKFEISLVFFQVITEG